MGSFVINKSTHLIFHTDLILSSCSHVKDTWNSRGIHHASVCCAACFQVLGEHLLHKLVYSKVKKIKISVFLLMIACFVIDIFIPTSHKFCQRLQRHWHLKILVSVCDPKLVRVESRKSWSQMDGLSKYRTKLLAFPVISDLLSKIYIWNHAGKPLQSPCLFTTVHSTWGF